MLKPHCFEDTEAIVASTTTSIPESAGSGRTSDYRYCRLRDAYHVLGAFRILGQFEEREQFIQYLFNIVAATPALDLAPLYRIDGTSNLDEKVLEEWAGFEGEKPVRIGNAARQASHTTSVVRTRPSRCHRRETTKAIPLRGHREPRSVSCSDGLGRLGSLSPAESHLLYVGSIEATASSLARLARRRFRTPSYSPRPAHPLSPLESHSLRQTECLWVRPMCSSRRLPSDWRC